jgi:hypothetical protein
MKKSELKTIIKEQIKSILKENTAKENDTIYAVIINRFELWEQSPIVKDMISKIQITNDEVSDDDIWLKKIKSYTNMSDTEYEDLIEDINYSLTHPDRFDITESVGVNQIELPNCNLYIKKLGMDVNGNRIITVGFPNDKGFSIQTNGTLKKTHRIISGLKNIKEIPASDIEIIGNEVYDYVSKVGSKNQKSRLKLYK